MFKKLAILGVLLSFVLFGVLLKTNNRGVEKAVSKKNYIGWGKYTESQNRSKPLDFFKLR